MKYIDHGYFRGENRKWHPGQGLSSKVTWIETQLLLVGEETPCSVLVQNRISPHGEHGREPIRKNLSEGTFQALLKKKRGTRGLVAAQSFHSDLAGKKIALKEGGLWTLCRRTAKERLLALGLKKDDQFSLRKS